jgi:hypothetical protein
MNYYFQALSFELSINILSFSFIAILQMSLINTFDEKKKL